MNSSSSSVPRARRHRRRLGVAGAVLATALAIAVVLSMLGRGGGFVPVSQTMVTRADFVVSYSGVAARLDGLDQADALDQVRDWTRIGLAAHLGMDTAAMRDSSFDTLPVRDNGFADLARQDVGPGRSLIDATGELHLLVP